MAATVLILHALKSNLQPRAVSFPVTVVLWPERNHDMKIQVQEDNGMAWALYYADPFIYPSPHGLT